MILALESLHILDVVRKLELVHITRYKAEVHKFAVEVVGVAYSFGARKIVLLGNLAAVVVAEVGEVKVVDRIAVRKFVVEVHKFVEMCPAVVAVRRQELAQKQDFVHILVEMIPLL